MDPLYIRGTAQYGSQQRERLMAETQIQTAVRKKRLAIVVNTIAPYRIPIYAALAHQFDAVIFHGGNEANRHWKLKLPDHLREQRVWTLQIQMKKHIGVAGHSDISYVHFNGGLAWKLPLFRPDIVLSNELGFRTILSLIYAKLSGADLWVWWGGTLHSESLIGGFKKRLRRFLARRIPHWVSYGATSTEYLQSLGVARENVLQIQNCVPHETFIRPPANPEPQFPNSPHPIILSVGQLIERKGLDKLVDACGRLAQRGYKFTLLLVGSGPLRDSLTAKAKQAGIADFQILPNQSQEELNRLYREAQVFVFPTLEDVWGLVVNEAVWAGCPVLCSTYAGCAAELVPPENVFDPMSPANFDRALERVFEGSVQRSDCDKLLSIDQVAQLIGQSLDLDRPVSHPPQRQQLSALHPPLPKGLQDL